MKTLREVFATWRGLPDWIAWRLESVTVVLRDQEMSVVVREAIAVRVAS